MPMRGTGIHGTGKHDSTLSKKRVSYIPVYGGQTSHTDAAWTAQGDHRAHLDKSKFDKLVSIKFVSVVLVTASTGHGRLYDGTSAAALTNSELTITNTSWALAKSADFKDDLPDSEVDLYFQEYVEGGATVYFGNMYIEIVQSE